MEPNFESPFDDEREDEDEYDVGGWRQAAEEHRRRSARYNIDNDDSDGLFPQRNREDEVEEDNSEVEAEEDNSEVEEDNSKVEAEQRRNTERRNTGRG